MEKDIRSYTIPLVNWERFTSKIAKLNKKAAEIGCTGVSYNIVSEFSKKISPTDERAMSFKTVEVTGDAPKFSGWTFVAKLEPFESGHIIRAIPGEVVPERFRELDHLCQHCNLVKTNRKLYYLLRHEDDTFFKVGSSCLKDFLGHKSPEAIAALMELILNPRFEDEEAFEPSSSPREWMFAVHDIMSVAARIMRFTGYKKASETSSESTRDDVAFFLSPGMTDKEKEEKAEFRKKYAIDDEARALAKRTKEWILSMPKESLSDYWHNLFLCVSSDFVPHAKIALLASAVWGYEKEVEKRELIKKEAKSNEFVGVVGEKLTLEDLVFVGSKWFSSRYNQDGTYLLRFEDKAGNSFVWFTSGVGEVDGVGLSLKGKPFVINEPFPLKGTVKEHKLYEERKQTLLTRCKPL